MGKRSARGNRPGVRAPVGPGVELQPLPTTPVAITAPSGRRTRSDLPHATVGSRKDRQPGVHNLVGYGFHPRQPWRDSLSVRGGLSFRRLRSTVAETVLRPARSSSRNYTKRSAAGCTA